MAQSEQEAPAVAALTEYDRLMGRPEGRPDRGNDLPRRRPTSGVADAPRLPDTPIFDMVSKAQTLHRENDATMATDPENTPDITRTGQMLDGVVQGVERAVADLVARLAPVLTDMDAPTSAAFEQTKKSQEGGRNLMPESAHGQHLWSLYSRLSAVESVLTVTQYKLGV